MPGPSIYVNSSTACISALRVEDRVSDRKVSPRFDDTYRIASRHAVLTARSNRRIRKMTESLRDVQNTAAMMMRRKEIPEDYSTLPYTRIKLCVRLPVPAFDKAFASALCHDSNPLLCFSMLGEESDADDEGGPPDIPERPEERIIAYLTPRMACKMFWQGLALCKKLEGETKIEISGSCHPYPSPCISISDVISPSVPKRKL